MAFKNKAKGTKYENELYDSLVKEGYRCIRSAGSGTKDESNADLIAGKNNGEKYAIEVKSSKSPSKYITKEQIEQFMIFSEIFGLTPVVAFRFNREGWFFISPSELRDSGKNWVFTLDDAKKTGRRFGQFFCVDSTTGEQ